MIPRSFAAVLLALLLAACATAPPPPAFQPPPPEYARAPRADGAFTDVENWVRGAGGPEVSGFMLLDSNESGLRWRLALIDAARHTIDLQYYVWYDDTAGFLLFKRLRDAAERGVKVRLLVDDLNTIYRGGTTVQLRDTAAAFVDSHPNFEIRLFNPWTKRELAGRVGESLSDTGRVNQRMHNKQMIVDNQAAIIGGRNIGDDYLGLHPESNFHDLDVLGVGPVARQGSAVFDLYWNSPLVMPVSALKIELPAGDPKAIWAKLAGDLAATPSLAKIPVAPQSWSGEIAALKGRLHLGTSRLYADVPEAKGIRHVMMEKMFEVSESAKEELLIVNAYIIPAQRSIDSLSAMTRRGVRIAVLTNSLASHDVPAVNSHYKQWRAPILQTGTRLFEIRHDAAIKPEVAETPPTRSKHMGLHSKGMVVDRKRAYIGSMNFDPRSAQINSEMGLVIESPGVADALAKVMERDMLPANSWQVTLEGGELRWRNDKEVVTRQPARSFRQRVEDVVFMLFPKDLY